MNSATLMLATRLKKPATIQQRSHLTASLNFQSELEFNEAAYHLEKAGLPDLAEKARELAVMFGG